LHYNAPSKRRKTHETDCHPVAFRQGTKITITIEGLKAKDNPDIKAMLSSLVLK